MKKVLVIGGGASGLMAAISAARAGASVTLLEHNRQVGKKILVTGNGRCNLTNVNQAAENYRGTHPEFASEVLKLFGKEDTLRLFTDLGVFTKNRSGGLYPYSDQALAVADVLRMEAEQQKVRLVLNTEIRELVQTKSGFAARTENWSYEGEALILAAGSCAAPQTGSDGSGYAFAKKLGHRIVKPLPALVQLRSRDRVFAKLSGLRMDAGVTIYIEESAAAQDTGEVQFTSYGLSGIPIFQVSRFAVRALDAGKRVWADLDLMPLFSEEAFFSFLEQRIRTNTHKTAEQLLVGLFPRKMADCLLLRTGILGSLVSGELTGAQVKALSCASKHFSVELSGFNGFEQAQVCSGGVDTEEVDSRTMESKLLPGLYFAGEILDIDGACGGYNLQWAWSSGYVAGLYAAEERTS